MTLKFSTLSRHDNARQGQLAVESKHGSWSLTTPTFLQYFKLNSERLRLLESLPLQELCLGTMFFLDYGGITTGKKWVESLRSNPDRLHELFRGPLCSFPVVDLNLEHVDPRKPSMHSPSSAARFFSEVELDIVAPPCYVCRASLSAGAASELQELNLESTKIFLNTYREKIKSGATVFVHLLPNLDVALRDAGFDPISLDGLVIVLTQKLEQMGAHMEALQSAMQAWENPPRLMLGGSRLKFDNLVKVGADLITSPEPSWRALYYQYLVPFPEGKAATIRIKSVGCLKRLECDCPVCAKDLLAKAFSRSRKTQFINLLCIHNNNIAWRQLEMLRSIENKP